MTDKITGYRNLTEAETKAANDIKYLANSVGDVCDSLAKFPEYDQRWLAIGRTHLQEGFMALVRAITRPGSF